MKRSLLLKMEFSYWNDCLIRLGLDSVLPIYESIGLFLDDKQKFQEKLKQLIISNLKKDSEYDYPYFQEKIIIELENYFNICLSERDYTNFLCFATTIFYSGSSGTKDWLDWRDWEDDLKKAIFHEKYYQNLIVTPNELTILKELKESYNIFYNSDSYKWLENYNYEQLSEWDKKIFKIAKFDIDSDFKDPFLQLGFTANMNLFQLFWEKYVLVLAKNDLDNIYNICNAIQIGKNSANFMMNYKNSDGEDVAIEVPGNVFQNLKKPHEMRRCVIDIE